MSGYGSSPKRHSSNKEYGRRDSNTLPDLYHIFKGQVVRIQHYGAFVSIPGCRRQGLLHISQISNTKVESVEEVLAIGDSVYCKVTSVQVGDDDRASSKHGDHDADEDRFSGATSKPPSSSSTDKVKISLSMKLVDQGSGRDLDPQNVQASLDSQRQRERPSERKKIVLEAVLNTTCTKCGGKGHLSRDCFHVAGGARYDLLPDLDDMMKEQEEKLQLSLKSSTLQKKPKKRSRSSSTSSSSSSPSSSPSPSRHRHKHKRPKQAKKKEKKKTKHKGKEKKLQRKSKKLKQKK